MLAAVGGLATLACNDPEVRFGRPGGLRVRGGLGGGSAADTCPYPPGTDETGATCPDWATEVYPLLDGPYACTKDGCHLPPGGEFNLNIPTGDPDGAYDALADYKNGDRPYIGEDLQSTAYILCNIWTATDSKIGSFMPLPGQGVTYIEDADLTLIANWVACGMKREGGGTGGAGGGG